MSKKEYGKKLLQKMKEESGCVDCGLKHEHWFFDWDHLPGSKNVGNPTQRLPGVYR